MAAWLDRVRFPGPLPGKARVPGEAFTITVAHYPIVGVRGSAIAVPAGDNFPPDQAAGAHVDARHEREELLEPLAEPANTKQRHTRTLRRRGTAVRNRDGLAPI